MAIASTGCPEDEEEASVPVREQLPEAGPRTADGGPDGRVAPTPAPAPSAPAAAADQGTFDGQIVAAALTKSVGGFAVPIWLYKGGVYPTDDEGLLPIPAQAVRHRAANPDLWSPWRRTPQGVERMLDDGTWSPLPYKDEYAALARSTRISGTFVDSDAYQQFKYRFTLAGRFEYCHAFSVLLEAEYGSGTYEIDGYVIRLRYSDAPLEALSFVHDPMQRPNSMWVDGGPFKRDNSAAAASAFECP